MNLVDAIEKRIASPARLTDYAAITHRTRLPTATHEEIEEAELKIGSPLPAILALLLRDVANGGFGPGDGLLGVGPEGHRYEGADLMLNLPDLYRLNASEDTWDKDQLAIVDFGDVIWGTVSLSTGLVSTSRGDTGTYEAQHREPTAVDLETWLMRWAQADSTG